jgi:DNA recombination protein RmuC
MTEILFLIIGMIVGAVSVWLVSKFRFEGKQSISEERLKGLSETVEKAKIELDDKEKEIIELNRQVSARDTEFRNLNEKLQEQKNEIDKLQEKFRIEFKNLANEIFEEKSKRFTEQNKIKLDEILKPLGEKIRDFEKKVEETYDKEAQQRYSLKEEVKRLAELNQEVSKEASNLTKALKGDTKARGSWGEVILESILERSGLVKDREYFIQASYTDDNGKKVQPDVIVAYPGDRRVVIDSKVSLLAYERYVSNDDKREQDKALKDHLQSVRNHIRILSEKNYQDIYQIKSLDFVMMFMPVEPAYYLAIQDDTELWNYAYEKRILLISPTNLIAALKMIESMWRQEYQSKNVMEIARRSGALYDKFEGLLSDLVDIGKKLDAAQNSYKSSMVKLSEGKGNLISRVEQIKKLGAKTKKSLPQNLLDRAVEKEELE